jgi:phosphonatase-like hydrolase
VARLARGWQAPPVAIRLAVLDMAGTTIRDDGSVERAFLAAFHAIGEDPAPHLGAVRATMGQSKLEVFTALLGDAGRARCALEAFDAAYHDAVAGGQVEPLPGAETALHALRAAGVHVCLTTGFSREVQAHLVDVLGWRDLVDLALAPDADEGLRGRPHPDLILAAVLRLHVDDVRDVAVAGDTTNDLLAGWRAGASVLAGVLGGAHDASTLSTAPHTHLIDGIEELPAIVLSVP